MTTNVFYPKKAYINAITNAQEAVVTFTENHDYLVGEIVSFRVSKSFGMVEIQNRKAKILSKTSDTITVDIDSTTWTPFNYSLINTSGTSPPLCVPVASGSVDNGGVEEVIFADAFDNRRA